VFVLVNAFAVQFFIKDHISFVNKLFLRFEYHLLLVLLILWELLIIIHFENEWLWFLLTSLAQLLFLFRFLIINFLFRIQFAFGFLLNFFLQFLFFLTVNLKEDSIHLNFNLSLWQIYHINFSFLIRFYVFNLFLLTFSYFLVIIYFPLNLKFIFLTITFLILLDQFIALKISNFLK
jgi:hypothetical protein